MPIPANSALANTSSLSAFGVFLPQAFEPAAAPVPPPAQEDAPLLRILVVDDHEVTRRAFSLTLSPICDVIYMAEDGEEALRALAHTHFDLVFMDVHMPRMGGVETVCRLRDSDLPGAATPVVAIAAGLSDADRRACVMAGVNGFAETPLEAKALFALVHLVIAQARAQDEAA